MGSPRLKARWKKHFFFALQYCHLFIAIFVDQ